MALSTSPRKVVPLATGADWQLVPKHIPTGPAFTKRVFYCGVVVENSENGRRLPQGALSVVYGWVMCRNICITDVQDLVASFGEPLGLNSDDLLSSPVDTDLDSIPDHVSNRIILFPTLCRVSMSHSVSRGPRTLLKHFTKN